MEISQIKIKFDEEKKVVVSFDDSQFMSKSVKDQLELFNEIQEKNNDPESNNKAKTFMDDIDMKIKLTNNLIRKSLYPKQTLQNLEILETLPNEITCWVDSLKGTLTSSVASIPKHSNSKMGALFDGTFSLESVASITNTLNNLVKGNGSTSSQRFLQVSAEMKMAQVIKTSSEAQQWQPPSITYVWPFVGTFGGTRL